MESPTPNLLTTPRSSALTPPMLMLIMGQEQQDEAVTNKLLLKPKAQRFGKNLQVEEGVLVSTPLSSFSAHVAKAPRFPDALSPDSGPRRPNLAMKKRGRESNARTVLVPPIHKVASKPPLMNLDEPLEATSTLLLPDIPYESDSVSSSFGPVGRPTRRLRMRSQPAAA